MICKKCNHRNSDNDLFCRNCGASLKDEATLGQEIVNVDTKKIEPIVETTKVDQIGVEPKITNVLPTKEVVKNNDLTNTVNKKFNIKEWFTKYKKIIFIIFGFLLIVGVVLVFVFVLNREDRNETLGNLKEKNRLMFTVDDNEYYLGQKVSILEENGLSYNDNYIKDTDYIINDSITVYPFYFDNKAIFLGALYCSGTENCKYDDAILIKANFYDNSNVVIDDFLKIGTSYDDIKEEYGKEDGEFYQDEELLVWSFGEEVGDPYYLLRFNSSKKVEEIRIGVWWYEEEYDYTID